jgi:predicted membrane protein
MNEEQFKEKIEEGRQKWERKRTHGRIWTGFLLLVIGVLLFVKTANLFFFPAWFFTWPVLLIILGLFSGLKHRFRGGFWFILILVGGFSLMNDLNPNLNLDRYEWPAIFMVLGLMFILRPRKSRWRSRRAYWTNCERQESYAYNPQPQEETNPGDRRDFVDVTAVFGEVKKNVMSKTFRGGDIVSFMGGSKIDMSQADFQGRVRIDVTNIFGGTKLVVPPTWDVQSDVTALFGGVDDKRKVEGVQTNPEKVLVLDGTCLFGGIEIRSF